MQKAIPRTGAFPCEAQWLYSRSELQLAYRCEGSVGVARARLADGRARTDFPFHFRRRSPPEAPRTLSNYAKQSNAAAPPLQLNKTSGGRNTLARPLRRARVLERIRVMRRRLGRPDLDRKSGVG